MIGKLAYRALCALCLGPLAGCLEPFPPHAGTTERPALDPEVFFSGLTRGEGTLVTLTGARTPLLVEGHGRLESDGIFRLDQRVKFATGRTETRTWRLRKIDSERYSAILSDAAGEVSAQATGNLFHLRYLLRKPAVYMEQWLYLQPDGRTVLNLATVSVIGIPWARLSEKIERVESPPAHPL